MNDSMYVMDAREVFVYPRVTPVAYENFADRLVNVYDLPPHLVRGFEVGAPVRDEKGMCIPQPICIGPIAPEYLTDIADILSGQPGVTDKMDHDYQNTLDCFNVVPAIDSDTLSLLSHERGTPVNRSEHLPLSQFKQHSSRRPVARVELRIQFN